jgi:hypothetical protein
VTAVECNLKKALFATEANKLALKDQEGDKDIL